MQTFHLILLILAVLRGATADHRSLLELALSNSDGHVALEKQTPAVESIGLDPIETEPTEAALEAEGKDAADADADADADAADDADTGVEVEPYEPAIKVDRWRFSSPSTAASSRVHGTDGEKSLYYSITYEATIMSLEPRNFISWRLNDYLDRTVDYLNETTGDQVGAWVNSVHGEDKGSGVVTTVIFYTGGRKAADNFRSFLQDWDNVQDMYPRYPFGKGCHMEGYSWPCVRI